MVDVVSQVLVNRGIEPERVYDYLHPTDKDILNPLLLDNMSAAAALLARHMSQRSRVGVCVDADCDGMTSSAILLNYLNRIAPNWVQTCFQYWTHDEKKHGIYLDEIPDGIQLLIVPDAASENYDECEELRARGVDVLILDHHSSRRVPSAAVVVNNQLCSYPTKSLSGAGIAWKFCCYLDSLLGTDYAQDYVDLAALGIVIDVMNLADQETRAIVHKGFTHIKNQFFKAYIDSEEYSMKGAVNPFTTGWYIGPGINATTRSGSQEENLFLFEAFLEFKCNEIVPSTKRGCSGQTETHIEQAIRNCKNIRSRQNKVVDELVEIIEKRIEEEHLLDNKLLIVTLTPEEANRRSTLGLLANKLQSKYQRPACVLTKTKNGLEGSGRNYPGCPIKNLNQWLVDTGLVSYCAGHSSAFGLGLPTESLAQLTGAANQALKDFDCSPTYNVDFIYQASNFKAKDISDLAVLKDIWGHGIEEPLIAIENIPVYAGNIQLLSPDKHPTIKISLSNGVEIMKFKSSEDEYNTLYSRDGCTYINVVGTCKINDWNNVPQLFVQEYEITGQKEYYF